MKLCPGISHSICLIRGLQSRFELKEENHGIHWWFNNLKMYNEKWGIVRNCTLPLIYNHITLQTRPCFIHIQHLLHASSTFVNDSSIIHRSVSSQMHSSHSLIFSHVILLFTIFNTCCVGGILGLNQGLLRPMRPKARELVQHGGPPGEEWPGRCDFACDGRAVPPAFSVPYRTGCPDRSCPAVRCRNFHLLLYTKCTQPSVMSYTSLEEGMAWYSSRPMPFSMTAKAANR